MLNRVLVVAATLVLFASVPVGATGLHTEKGASGQGLASDANFDSPTTVNGISVTPFFNNNDPTFPLIDVFQIPSDFTSGTDFALTFGNINLGYGIFDCDNGANNFAVSEDSPPVNLVGPCTPGPLGSNEAFVNFVESGNTSTISFLGGAGAPSTFFFWTTDGNLLNISPVSGSGSAVPEPSSLLLLGPGLAGLAMLRRRLKT